MYWINVLGNEFSCAVKHSLKIVYLIVILNLYKNQLTILVFGE